MGLGSLWLFDALKLLYSSIPGQFCWNPQMKENCFMEEFEASDLRLGDIVTLITFPLSVVLLFNGCGIQTI